jgi:hypothetical protein
MHVSDEGGLLDAITWIYAGVFGVSTMGLARLSVRLGQGSEPSSGAGYVLPSDSEWMSVDLSAYPPGTSVDVLRERFGEPVAVEATHKLVLPDPDSPVTDSELESAPEPATVRLEAWFYPVAPEQADRPTGWLVFDIHEEVVHASRVQEFGPGGIATDTPPSGTPDELEGALIDAVEESEVETLPADDGPSVGSAVEDVPESPSETGQDALSMARLRASSRPLRPGRWAKLDEEFPDAPEFEDLVQSVLGEVGRPPA